MTLVLRTQGHVVSTNMSFTNKLLKGIVCFRRLNVKISARSRKLPCKNIVKKCDDNNYINSISYEKLLRVRCAKQVLNFFVNTFGIPLPPPPAYQKAGYATDEPLQKKHCEPP